MKLSLRELFGLVMIVALALGWWIDHQRQERMLREAAVWRHASGFFEDFLVDRGYEVRWELGKHQIIHVKGHGYYHGGGIALSEPTPSPWRLQQSARTRP